MLLILLIQGKHYYNLYLYYQIQIYLKSDQVP